MNKNFTLAIREEKNILNKINDKVREIRKVKTENYDLYYGTVQVKMNEKIKSEIKKQLYEELEELKIDYAENFININSMLENKLKNRI